MQQAVARGPLSFTVANSDDDTDVRRLLRENPLGGAISVSLEREPTAFHKDATILSRTFIVARDTTTGAAVGVCERVVRNAYVDGRIAKLPYLGALRVAQSHRNLIGMLRGGFAALKRMAEKPDELPYALTSITRNNDVARRILTRGLPGLPLYREVGGFSTFALRPRRAWIAPNIEPAHIDELPAIAAFLSRENARFQFAMPWSAPQLDALGAFGLPPEHILVARSDGAIIGTLTVWDQRSFKQAIVHRYPAALAALRPLVNTMAPLTGYPTLPARGTPIAQGMLTHLAVAEDDPQTFLALIAAALDQAYARGLSAALVGFASDRPWHRLLRQSHRVIEYETMLYLAHWPDAASHVDALAPRIVHPELGFL